MSNIYINHIYGKNGKNAGQKNEYHQNRIRKQDMDCIVGMVGDTIQIVKCSKHFNKIDDCTIVTFTLKQYLRK